MILAAWPRGVIVVRGAAGVPFLNARTVRGGGPMAVFTSYVGADSASRLAYPKRPEVSAI